MTAGPGTLIVGHPRSGTSLLRALLDGHPSLNVLPFESHLLDWFDAPDPAESLLARTRLAETLLRHRPDTPEGRIHTVLAEHLHPGASAAEALQGLMAAWCELTGLPPENRWVEKTPRHLYELERLMPPLGAGARVIAIVRDPRDVVASQLAGAPDRSLFGAALTLRLATRVLNEWVENPRVHRIRYEALVTEPEKSMRAVCRFIEVEYDPVLLTPTALGGPYYGNSRFEESQPEISTDPAGRYRRVIPEQRLATLEALLGPALDGWPSPGLAGSGHHVERAALSVVERSGLWRLRSVRARFQGR